MDTSKGLGTVRVSQPLPSFCFRFDSTDAGAGLKSLMFHVRTEISRVSVWVHQFRLDPESLSSKNRPRGPDIINIAIHAADFTPIIKSRQARLNADEISLRPP